MKILVQCAIQFIKFPIILIQEYVSFYNFSVALALCSIEVYRSYMLNLLLPWKRKKKKEKETKRIGQLKKRLNSITEIL